MSVVVHTLTLRIYYEDTDHGGVVYHANYLKYMERARTEALREAGIELDVVDRDAGALFAVTEANLRFRAPARYSDLLRVESRLIELQGARLAFRQSIYRLESEGSTLLVEGIVRLACMDRQGRARRIPPSLLPAMRANLSPE